MSEYGNRVKHKLRHLVSFGDSRVFKLRWWSESMKRELDETISAHEIVEEVSEYIDSLERQLEEYKDVARILKIAREQKYDETVRNNVPLNGVNIVLPCQIGDIVYEIYRFCGDGAWCDSEYTIIDDDIGQPVHPRMIRYCWRCGKKLKE